MNYGKTRLVASALSVAVLGASIAAADVGSMKDPISQGSPITADNIIDVMEIQRVIDAQANAFDNRQWDIAGSLVTDEFETTMAQPDGGVGVMSIHEFLEGVAAYQDTKENSVTHHSTSGYRIYFHDKDNATAFARGAIIVMTTPDGDFADTGGSLRMERWNSYEFGMVRTPEGWKINRILIEYNGDEITSLAKTN